MYTCIQTVYNRVARGMLHDDRVVLAVLLCRIRLKSVTGYCGNNQSYWANDTNFKCSPSLAHSESDYNAEFDYFLRGKESLRMDVRVPEVRGLNKEQTVCMYHLSKQLPAFTRLPSYIAENRVNALKCKCCEDVVCLLLYLCDENGC